MTPYKSGPLTTPQLDELELSSRSPVEFLQIRPAVVAELVRGYQPDPPSPFAELQAVAFELGTAGIPAVTEINCEQHGSQEVSEKTGLCQLCWGARLEAFWDALDRYVVACGGKPRPDRPSTKRIAKEVDGAMILLCELATYSHPVIRAFEEGIQE